ncbi:unnamed protein product [Paramecium pentaurelia]|uniref:Uncharacterized protein n=1 Tax=Paramecium pentaurelia TaxID=43138 RepID=A0A8S1U9B2_9CILI|nr:unnamed protein product [Paramecium pentaurelia]
MQLKCAEYLKEAVNTNIEQIRYSFMSKACKQIAQLLPFQSMWHLLLKQENLFFYMLMLQSMFGQNIKMLLELIIERFAPITQFQIQFLNACTLVFSQDTYMLSDVIKSHLPNIYKECITQLQFFIKQIPKNDSKEGQSVAEQIAQAYKTILGNIHDQQVTIELYTSLQQIVHKWPLIHDINPLIFHEVEEIIAMRTPRNVEIQFYEEPTECDSPSKSNSIRKENQIVVELQRWLSKMNYPIPIISKRIASSVINSQNIFKLKENIEIMLSFIYCPLKYEPANQKNQNLFENFQPYWPSLFFFNLSFIWRDFKQSLQTIMNLIELFALDYLFLRYILNLGNIQLEQYKNRLINAPTPFALFPIRKDPRQILLQNLQKFI